jgi:hypothetical protein
MTEPSNAERAEWPDTTRDYVEWLEAELETLRREVAAPKQTPPPLRAEGWTSEDFRQQRKDLVAHRDELERVNRNALEAAGVIPSDVRQDVLRFAIPGGAVDFWPRSGKWRIVGRSTGRTYHGGAERFVAWLQVRREQDRQRFRRAYATGEAPPTRCATCALFLFCPREEARTEIGCEDYSTAEDGGS